MSEVRTLVTGLRFGESPRWHAGRLWLCNWGASEVLAVDLDGKSEVMATVPTTIPFSIDWLADGTLVVVSGQEGLLLRQEASGALVPYADLRAIDQGFNEIVVDGRGNAYVNFGIIALVTPDGAVRQVADNIAFGNGMAVTPDNSTLIVAESHAHKLTAFSIGPDRSLTDRRVWADLNGDSPDGICLDSEGAVWYASVPGQNCVRVREGGQVLQTIDVGRGCFACMLGGPDNRTLFMLAAEWLGMDKMVEALDARTGQVLTALAPAPHAGWP